MREIKLKVWDTKHLCWWNFDDPADDLEDDEVGLGGGNVLEFRLPERLRLVQYTGLKDKNGIEIYEGNLLRWIDWQEELTEEPDVYRVDWLAKEARFSLNCFRSGRHLDPKDDVFQPDDQFEVIGNIFENPDLLDSQL
jgi:uncharacterized phage protein (TIGR01671 family)